MITREQWKIIKHFKPNEKNYLGKRGAFGDLKLFQFKVLYLLDQMTDFAKALYWYKTIYCIVHCGTQGIHSENSQHYLGLAVDVHYTNLTLFEQIQIAQMFQWHGIGFYPTWKHPGLHLDLREQQDEFQRKAMWYTYTTTVNNKTVIKYENNKKEVISKIRLLAAA